MIEDAPEIYQDTSSGRIRVAGRYRLLDAHTAGFEIDAYDASLPLVIDPVISYATYMGGTGLGAVTGVALDSSGDLYAPGWTEALNFPIVLAEQAASGGSVDAFIVKLNPTGTALLYATYIGGSGDDRAAAIAVNASGQAYVTGSTASPNFPLHLPLRTTLGGAKTAFVLKLNATGNQLLYSTYLGGTNYDLGTAIAVDTAGNAYIAGDTHLDELPGIRRSPSSLRRRHGCLRHQTDFGRSVFPTALTWAARQTNIRAESQWIRRGAAYVTGGTFSTNFPLAGAIQTTNHGGQDAFVSKLSASGRGPFIQHLSRR